MIRRLPKDVVDRIAAGEVIERPASVVKELVENALDAGAKQIEISLEKGGKQLIRVADDGCGITREDLELAFVPHATSKLAEVDDLLAIASYGFRGEALASIGAVSRARIRSKAEDADAFEIHCEGGVMGEVKPCAAPRGTAIEARNLFYNVPARARFLKGDAAEASRCLDQVLRFALVDSECGFRLTHNERVAFEVPQNASRPERFAAAYGQEVAAGLMGVDAGRDGIFVEGLLAPPSAAKASARQQLVFLNGRVVTDGTIKTAVRQAYREFLAPTLQPVYAVFVTIDPAEVDVNVHPAKSEVRYRDSNAVFRAVYHAVLDRLRGGDLTPRAPSQPPRSREDTPPRSREDTPPSRSPARPAAPRAVQTSLLPPLSPLPDMVAETPAEVDATRATAPEPAAPPVAEGESAGGATIDPAGRSQRTAPLDGRSAIPPRTGRGWLRLFSTYIAYESHDDMVLVDQHALHERVLFERMRRQLAGGGIQSQRLLMPSLVEVGRSHVVELEERTDAFAAVGLEVSAFSETALAVHAVPTVLRRGDPDELVRAVLESLTGADKRARSTLEEPLHTMACRGAVKAGDDLSDEEIQALLADAEAMPEARACPHGRPTSIRMTRVDLERWFKRSGF